MSYIVICVYILERKNEKKYGEISVRRREVTWDKRKFIWIRQKIDTMSANRRRKKASIKIKLLSLQRILILWHFFYVFQD